MDKKLPDVDLPVDFLAEIQVTEEILNWYKFPCRIKATLFALCSEGELDAMINVTEYHIKKNDLICLAPNSIIQFHSMTEKMRIYFIGFSSGFIEKVSFAKSFLDFLPYVIDNPVSSLPENAAEVCKDYFALLYKACVGNLIKEKDQVRCILESMLNCISSLYSSNFDQSRFVSRSENIYRQLLRLVMKHYEENRQVSFYARLLNITPQHLSSVVKQVAGKTVSDVIADIVIMDMKAKLKSTDMSIQEISNSLNFPNVSFFGKYFKRYVGMAPNEYRQC